MPSVLNQACARPVHTTLHLFVSLSPFCQLTQHERFRLVVKNGEYACPEGKTRRSLRFEEVWTRTLTSTCPTNCGTLEYTLLFVTYTFRINFETANRGPITTGLAERLKAEACLLRQEPTAPFTPPCGRVATFYLTWTASSELETLMTLYYWISSPTNVHLSLRQTAYCIQPPARPASRSLPSPTQRRRCTLQVCDQCQSTRRLKTSEQRGATESVTCFARHALSGPSRVDWVREGKRRGVTRARERITPKAGGECPKQKAGVGLAEVCRFRSPGHQRPFDSLVIRPGGRRVTRTTRGLTWRHGRERGLSWRLEEQQPL